MFRSLSPENIALFVVITPGPEIAIHTVPTGFSSDPPPGPAIPEVAIDQSEPNNRFAPSAIAITHSSLTAPNLSIIDGRVVAVGKVLNTKPQNLIGKKEGTQFVIAGRKYVIKDIQ